MKQFDQYTSYNQAEDIILSKIIESLIIVLVI